MYIKSPYSHLNIRATFRSRLYAGRPARPRKPLSLSPFVSLDFSYPLDEAPHCAAQTDRRTRLLAAPTPIPSLSRSSCLCPSGLTRAQADSRRYNILHRSTSSTMSHFLTSFVSVDLPLLTKVMVVSMSPEGQDVTVRNGSMKSHAFAKDSGTLLAHSPPLSLLKTTVLARKEKRV